MRRYLEKLFANWKIEELFPLKEQNGVTILWKGTFQKPGSDKMVEINGIDLVILQETLVQRNEVYFDKSILNVFNKTN